MYSMFSYNQHEKGVLYNGNGLEEFKAFISAFISLAIFVPQVLFAKITITAIDVGQGDAVLVQHESYAVLIDGGRSANTVADYLKDKGISHINLMMATHAHADHIGGLAAVLNRKTVGKVLYNGQTHTTFTFENFIDAVLACPFGEHAWKNFPDRIMSVINP